MVRARSYGVAELRPEPAGGVLNVAIAGQPLLVYGMPLPEALTRALVERRWVSPPRADLRRVFREASANPVFYDLTGIRRVNARWRVETNPAFFGHPDTQSPPGDLDPRSSLLLGELAADCPFALDYRRSFERPHVVYLHSGGDRWITVARDIDELIVRLRMNDRRRPRRVLPPGDAGPLPPASGSSL